MHRLSQKLLRTTGIRAHGVADDSKLRVSAYRLSQMTQHYKYQCTGVAKMIQHYRYQCTGCRKGDLTLLVSLHMLEPK